MGPTSGRPDPRSSVVPKTVSAYCAPPVSEVPRQPWYGALHSAPSGAFLVWPGSSVLLVLPIATASQQHDPRSIPPAQLPTILSFNSSHLKPCVCLVSSRCPCLVPWCGVKAILLLRTLLSAVVICDNCRASVKNVPSCGLPAAAYRSCALPPKERLGPKRSGMRHYFACNSSVTQQLRADGPTEYICRPASVEEQSS